MKHSILTRPDDEALAELPVTYQDATVTVRKIDAGHYIVEHVTYGDVGEVVHRNDGPFLYWETPWTPQPFRTLRAARDWLVGNAEMIEHFSALDDGQLDDLEAYHEDRAY